ncbi:MAG: cupin domain-containing protein [Proteobacteria bacterium]|nr:cupin domain-containing protein [Pseudomonadota bacterium]
MKNRARNLIESLGLSPHPEGGYYKEIYRSESTVHSSVAKATRNALTDIYFLLFLKNFPRSVICFN